MSSRRPARLLIVNPEEWHDGEAGADEGWAYRTFYPSVPLMSGDRRASWARIAPRCFRSAIIDDGDLVQALGGGA